MFNKALLLSTTVLLTLIARGVNAEQCEGSNPNPTGQGFGAIYNAKAKWTGPPDQKVWTVRLFGLVSKLKHFSSILTSLDGSKRYNRGSGVHRCLFL